MTEEKITELLLMNESLAEDVRALTYKVADLTETVEILTRVVTTEKAQDMIAEDAVVNMDKNLDRIRAAGDIKRFFAKKRLGIYLTEEGAEVAREYVKLFEEASK